MFEEQLKNIAAQHRLRKITCIHTAPGATIAIEGQRLIQLASNDYLGLARHPELIRAAVEATRRYGVGATAARLICGTLPPHRDLETALAKFKGAEAALTFGSGYLANAGILPSLIGRGGLILTDRLCHASLLDGCRLTGADLRLYRHGDMEHLESLLKRRPSRKVLVVTDGLFSMDGDLAPLPSLVDVAERYGAEIYVDDAHGTGVMGPSGRGTLEHFKLESRIAFHMGTLSKALGCSGAYVVGPATMIQYLINTSRTFMFTTAPPPAVAAAATAALRILEQEPERRRRLWANRDRLESGLRRLGFRLTDSASPILPVLIGDAHRATQFAEQLFQRGVYAPAIRPPTVPKTTSRIRVTITSEHTAAHIDEALAAFEDAGQAARVI